MGSAPRGSDLKPNSVTLIKGGIQYPCLSFSFEHRPIGISPSMGTVRIAVYVDQDSTTAVPEYQPENQSTPETGQTNYANATGKVRQNLATGSLPAPEGRPDSFDKAPEGQTDAIGLLQEGYKASAPKLSALLDGEEFSLLVECMTITDDAGDEAKEDTLRIDGLTVRYVAGTEDAPLPMNVVAVMELRFVDRRHRWAQLSNFNDSLNAFKGVDTNGQPTYFNDTIWNPGAAESERRAWSASDTVSYLISLMDDIAIGGSRNNGLSFAFEIDNYLTSGTVLSDQAVEDVSGIGANPALQLEELLRRWGMVIVYPHHGGWYIDTIERTSLYPKDNAQQNVISIAPQSMNARSLRAKSLVVQGNPIKVQEAFEFTEGADFEYVVPFEEEWLNLWFVWHQVVRGQIPDPSNYDPEVEYLDSAAKAELATLSAYPASDDYDAYIASAGFAESAENASSVVAQRVLRAIITVAKNGFRYVKLSRTGQYGSYRRPLSNLLSVNNLGDNNMPVVLADCWQQVMVRISTSSRAEVDGFANAWDKVKAIFTGEDSEGAPAPGDESKFAFSQANKNDYLRIPDFAQELTLEDAEAFVYSTNLKLIYPDRVDEGAIPSQADFESRATGVVDAITGLFGTAATALGRPVVQRNGSGASEPSSASLSEKFIEKHTYYTWAYNSTIQMLISSEFAATSFSANGSQGNRYSAEFSSTDGYDGKAYQFQDFLQLELILARISVGDTISIVDYNGAAVSAGDSYFPYVDTDETSPMDVLRQQLYPSLPASGKTLIDKIDFEAERVAKNYYDMSRFALGCDYEWAGLYVPSGGRAGGEQGSTPTSEMWYSWQLRTVLWYVDDSGAYTKVRMNGEGAFTPLVSNYERQYIEYLNQQRQYNEVKALMRFRKTAERMSGGKHDE